jgi:hypothetical protein
MLAPQRSEPPMIGVTKEIPLGGPVRKNSKRHIDITVLNSTMYNDCALCNICPQYPIWFPSKFKIHPKAKEIEPLLDHMIRIKIILLFPFCTDFGTTAINGSTVSNLLLIKSKK